MTRWWCSERPAKGLTIALCTLWIGWMPVEGVRAHPELQAQIEHLDEQLALAPGDVAALIRRGDLHRRHGDFDLAAADFRAARELDPHDPELDFFEGRLALDAGDPASAGRWLDRYLSRNPEHPVAWRLRALASREQGDFGSAAAGFGRAVGFSESPSPALYREWVLALDTAGDRQSALDAVDQGLARLGTEVSLVGLGADLALQQNEPVRARAYLDRLPDGLRAQPQWQERLRQVESQEAALPVR